MAFTHDFDISFAEDGSQFIIGEIEVDKDLKKADQKINSSSEPLSLEFLDDAVQLLKMITEMYVKYDGIKNITFKEKP